VPAAWATGSYVVTAGTEYHWDGGAWAVGRAVVVAGADVDEDVDEDLEPVE
jgi:hypothetical protein